MLVRMASPSAPTVLRPATLADVPTILGFIRELAAYEKLEHQVVATEALLRHLAGLAVARGCGRMDWNVLDWNAPAIGFYRKLGADLLPDWRTCRVTGDVLKALAENGGD